MKKYLLPNNVSWYRANLHCHTTISDGQLTPEEVKEAYKADNGGYAFKLSTTGFGGEIVIMCGIGPDGKITK